MTQRTFSQFALAVSISALAIVSCTKKEEANKPSEQAPAATSAPAPAANKIVIGHYEIGRAHV
mgnify:CR=1 FL=1